MAQLRPFLSYIFLTDDRSRLRAGWRLLIAVLLTGIFFNLVDWLRAVLSLQGPVPLFISLCIDAVVVTSALYTARRFVDKRPFSSLGLKVNKQMALDILAGIAMAFVLMGVVFLIELSLGWLEFKSFAWETEAPSSVAIRTLRFLGVYTLVAWNEELVYRGYILQTLTSGLNPFFGIAISSLYFGIEHLSNPNSNWMTVVGIFFIALFFVYGYTRTGQLWLPIGLHTGWNFFENSVFGFPVSGYDRPGLLNIVVTGPELWTGGAFGPEAGLIILPVCILGAVFIYLWSSRF